MSEASFLNENPRVQEISQSHLEQLGKLEQDKLEQLLKHYKEARNKLRDRLEFIPSGTFTSQKMKGVLIQLDDAIKAMESSLTKSLSDAFFGVTEVSLKHLVDEVTKFEEYFKGAIAPIKVNDVLVAMESKDLLANQYAASIKAYSEDLRQTITLGLTQGLIMQSTTDQVIRNLSKSFMFEEWKLRRIVRTEYHHIYNLSKMRGMGEIKESYLPDLKKTLFHPMDSRTAEDSKQAALKKLVVPIDEPFEYNFTRQLKDGRIKKEKRVFMTPPDRPNDRSILIPYRDEWVKEN